VVTPEIRSVRTSETIGVAEHDVIDSAIALSSVPLAPR
jgi:hypothetical protein